MFVPVFTINFLTILSFLCVIVSGNPIKRSEEEATGVRVSGLFGLFTTLATSALTTGEQVGIVILSSQTVFIQEPNFFPATEWGVPEPTRSSTSSSTYAAGAVAVTSTFGNTPYSFPTSGFPAASTQFDASSSEDSSTDAPASASASSSGDPFTDTPASASASTDSTPTLILTPIIEDKQQVAATTTSCNPAVAGVTIPASALTTGEYVAVEVLCEETIYIQEPNFFPTKTYYGASDAASASVATTSTMSASSSSAIAGAELQVLGKRAGDSVSFFANNMPTSLRHVNANRIQSVANGDAEAFK